MPTAEPAPAPSAEGRRLIEAHGMHCASAEMGRIYHDNEFYRLRERREAQAALLAYVAGLEAEVARLRDVAKVHEVASRILSRSSLQPFILAHERLALAIAEKEADAAQRGHAAEGGE